LGRLVVRPWKLSYLPGQLARWRRGRGRVSPRGARQVPTPDWGRAPRRRSERCRWPKCRPGHLSHGGPDDRRNIHLAAGWSGPGGGGGSPPQSGSPAAASAGGPAGDDAGARGRTGGMVRRPGQHELRYWDGQRWTEYVSNRGTQGVDPLWARGPPGVIGGPRAPPCVAARAGGRA